MRRSRALLLLLGASWGLAAGASAELLRCTGSDGRTIYTDDSSICPDAEPYQPNGRITRGQSASPTVAPSRRVRAQQREQRALAEQAEAARWRGKKESQQAALVDIAKRREDLRYFVTVCNRQGRVIRYDASGIERQVSCREIRAEFAGLEAQEASIQRYLAEELPQECRRAGCLPGWIR